MVSQHENDVCKEDYEKHIMQMADHRSAPRGSEVREGDEEGECPGWLLLEPGRVYIVFLNGGEKLAGDLEKEEVMGDALVELGLEDGNGSVDVEYEGL